MKQIATVGFIDMASNDEAIAIIKVKEGQIGLGLSLQHNSDLEVWLSLEAGERLIGALKSAIAMAKDLKSSN